ncbi:hypothetical protein [Pseudomonas sp. DC3000-4b1]|uniref:hypothetical protein n=1 Tax=Pseudomonas sp. DC3000-4b1 TaxID=2804666 RepID=UPI003CEB6680
MRWLFLLLLVLNGCYLVWNLQDAPVRAKQVSADTRTRSEDSGLQLLSEAGGKSASGKSVECQFLGGLGDRAGLETLDQALQLAQVRAQRYVISEEGGSSHWLRLPAGERLARHPEALEVSKNINGLKSEINPCEGIATPE